MAKSSLQSGTRPAFDPTQHAQRKTRRRANPRWPACIHGHSKTDFGCKLRAAHGAIGPASQESGVCADDTGRGFEPKLRQGAVPPAPPKLPSGSCGNVTSPLTRPDGYCPRHGGRRQKAASRLSPKAKGRSLAAPPLPLFFDELTERPTKGSPCGDASRSRRSRSRRSALPRWPVPAPR